MFEKVWIFGLKEQLAQEELAAAEAQIQIFLEAWSSHGSNITSTFKILVSQVIVILATPSGCAIDKLYREIKEKFNLIEDDQILVELAGKFVALNRSEFKEFYIDNKISKESYIVDTSIATISELMLFGIKKKIVNSWHVKLFS